jgi:hypothetical protein
VDRRESLVNLDFKLHKSKEAVTVGDLSSLLKLSTEFGKCEAMCISQDPRKKKIEQVTVYTWQEGLQYILGIYTQSE